MDPRKNPYTPNAGAMPVALVGRDDLIEDFETLLYRMQRGMTAQSMIITGLRGVGKTVLLNRFCDVAEDEGWSVVEMEASDNDEDTFRAELAEQLMDVLLELEPRRKTWSDKFKKAFTALKSLSLTIDPEGSISAGLNLEPGGTGVQRMLSADLTKTFQAVGQAAKEKKSGVVILLDEIQFLAKTQMEGLRPCPSHWSVPDCPRSPSSPGMRSPTRSGCSCSPRSGISGTGMRTTHSGNLRGGRRSPSRMPLSVPPWPRPAATRTSSRSSVRRCGTSRTGR